MRTPITTPPSPGPGALADHPYADLLGRVQKPGRYVGGEEQQVVKDPVGLRCRFVLAFPDLYDVGMSHLGTRILYDLVNREPDLACERAFSPWGDLEAELRAAGLPLVSLETRTPLCDFDVVGVSLQYELSYTNVLLNLDLGGIPLSSAERGDRDPIVIAGGPTATHPEPLADFIDAFLVGEAEEVLPGLLRTIGDLRAEGASREAILGACARIPGIYVPRFYRVAEDPRTGLQVVQGRTPEGEAASAPERVQRVWVRDLDAFPFPQRFPVPYAEAIFDRAAVEITRGCTEGCRFCQAGMIYRPVRERSPEAIVDAVLSGVDNAGFTETSLTALSTADVSCIDPLIKEIVPRLAERRAKLGVASLRAYGMSGDLLEEIKRVGISGLTFAPEAGTQRMRDVINKNVSDDDIQLSARRIFERGYDRMKLYFIIGLPTETDDDVLGIVDTGARVRRLAHEMGLPRLPQITCSVSQHVPKPHTPFQWAAMDGVADLRRKVDMLRHEARRARVSLKTHAVDESWLECLFARGDRRMGVALLAAYRAGARFDGWREYFSLSRWIDALEAAGIEPDRYTRTLPVGARLPWDHLDIGVDREFLADEYRKSLRGRSSPPCGKPAGAQVHPRNLEETAAQTGRLVCYDCGIACDMTQMRDERIDALHSLARMKTEREAGDTDEPDFPQAAGAPVVPLARLVGRLPRSKLDADSAFKSAAEAPFSRLRLRFGKHDSLRFLGHLDLLRVLPRAFRRAGIELSLTRGYNPVPRMCFGPALALGMGADDDLVDVDVILGESARDMDGTLTPAQRQRLAAELLARLQAVAPPGLRITGARLVEPDEARLNTLIDAADWHIALAPEALARAQAELPALLQGDAPIVAERRRVPKRQRGRAGASAGTVTEVDVRPTIIDASLDAEGLRLRLRADGHGNARIREVVTALLGHCPPERAFVRTGLLHRRGDAWVPVGGLGPVPRAVSSSVGRAGARTPAACPEASP